MSKVYLMHSEVMCLVSYVCALLCLVEKFNGEESCIIILVAEIADRLFSSTKGG